MSEIVIHVENLSKKYTISHLNRGRGNTETFREVVTEKTKKMFGFSSKNETAHTTEEFMALNNVSFEIKQAERVGIIGRNGAGKSTLLKILSRITEPTTGRIEITGRVASLLEVGTGFHPELTGRENIFLNGAVLGMGKQEISKKFTEIVEFAEIEKFLDTPVKRYSSGMYVRLAFAVAAHLEPDILIVDEVLAVGDAQFQKKCLGKMEDVGKSGRTVLFVSHNMGIIRQLCGRSFLLEKGILIKSGNTEDVIARYLSSGVVQDDNVVDLSQHPNRLGGMKPILKKLSIRNKLGILSTEFTQDDPISIVIEYESSENIPMSGCGFIIYNSEGIRVGGGNTYMSFMPPHRIPSKGCIIFNILPKQFTPDKYFVTVSLGTHQTVLIDKVENAICFSISQSDIYGTGYLLTKEDGVAAIAFSCDIIE